MLPPTDRALFRVLLRGCNKVEHLLRTAPAAPLASAITLRFLSEHAPATLLNYDGRVLQLADTLRRCSRKPPPDHLEVGFSALRHVGAISSWLAVNDRLHQLSQAGAPVEVGARAISEAIEPQLVDGDDEALSSEACEAILDDLAGRARQRIERDADAPSRLRTLAHINRVLFDEGGFGGVLPKGRLVADVAKDNEVDVASGSSLSRVLHSRRGLPELLCTVYAAVASRLGLRLGFATLPNSVLLRLEPEGDGDEVATAGGDDGGGDNVDSEEQSKLWQRAKRELAMAAAFGGVPPQDLLRTHDHRLWFVDPYNGGKVIPAEGCHAFLGRIGVEEADYEHYMAAVSPPVVYARVVHNLALWHDRRGDTDGSDFWRGVGHGIEPREAVESAEVSEGRVA